MHPYKINTNGKTAIMPAYHFDFHLQKHTKYKIIRNGVMR